MFPKGGGLLNKTGHLSNILMVVQYGTYDYSLMKHISETYYWALMLENLSSGFAKNKGAVQLACTSDQHLCHLLIGKYHI